MSITVGLVAVACAGATRATNPDEDAGHVPDASAPDALVLPPKHVPDAAMDVPTSMWPPHCDPGVGVPEDTLGVGGHVSGPTGPNGEQPGCSTDGNLCTTDVSFTPTTSSVTHAGVDTLSFEGAAGAVGTASFGIQLDATLLAVDSLVGVPVELQTWSRSLDCTGPSHGNVPGEQLIGGQTVLRDASGSILIANGISVLTAGGAMVYGVDSLRELTLEWVTTPEQDCSYRQVALKLTVTKTGATALGLWERPGHVQIGNDGYSFLALGVLQAPTGCGVTGGWVLVRDGFLHAPAAMP
ncbi:MAG TPA: hypothetical protein VH062_24100 [Polyangiaceae bacterium]|nr:hypothetical protein [Polyangiaceae bacterium]